MCHICHLHHHTSLCNQTQSNQSSGDTSQPSKNNQSSSSSRGSQQQQQHPQPQMKPSQNHQQPVVTQHKTNTQKQHASSTSSMSAHVTNINVSNFPHNVLPTATLDISYCHAKTFTHTFFDTGSQRSFVSPKLVKKLILPVIEQVSVHLSTFSNDTTLHLLDLVKIKVQMGKRRIPIKLLVHDSASMGYLNCLRIHNVVRMLETQGHQLADRNITSGSLTGIELLIGVDYFGTIPKWALGNKPTPYAGHTCSRIVCESKPELKLTEFWDLECIGVTQENLSPSERETVSIVRSF